MDSVERQASAARVKQVANALEEEIVLGWLQPRERLIEEDIAFRFEVKRHVVREAIAELERMGLVERVQNKGAAVRMLSPTEVRQIYSVREALETLAAQQIPLPPLPETITTLIEIQEQHAAAVERGDFGPHFGRTWPSTTRSSVPVVTRILLRSSRALPKKFMVRDLSRQPALCI